MTAMITPKNETNEPALNSQTIRKPKKHRLKLWGGLGVAVVVGVAGVAFAPRWISHTPVQSAPPPVSVTVSEPTERNLDTRIQFLGQFSAIEHVELRAQVGGTLTQIGFKDGDIVHKGDLLFQIDSTPYEIKLSQATAELGSANARLKLATREYERAIELNRKSVIAPQDVDQRFAEKQAAQAAVDNAQATVRDARFDLEHCRITAPFTGQIGKRLVSIGNLVAGSRAASSPTTLLATIVSLDPIYLDFDMSEADYMVLARQRENRKGQVADKIYVSLSDEQKFERAGTLDFVDNVLDRSSGTIHARATVPNGDLLLTPGGFARVRLTLPNPKPAFLVPDEAVLPDQAAHIVLTVGPDNVVTPKAVKIGDLRGGLRVIRSGIDAADKVIIAGIPTAALGSTVSPVSGSIHFDPTRD